MTTYELMIDTNHRLIKGSDISEGQKETIVEQLLAAANMPKRPFRSFGEQPDGKARRPIFFTHPYNDGKKLKTILGQIPKTHILSGNMYELDILRLLCLFAPNNPIVTGMTAQTVDRLKATCFGFHGCYLGECFDSALVVLRFLTIAAPDETEWMKKIVDIYKTHASEKRRSKYVEQYFKLCLSELPVESI